MPDLMTLVPRRDLRKDLGAYLDSFEPPSVAARRKREGQQLTDYLDSKPMPSQVQSTPAATTTQQTPGDDAAALRTYLDSFPQPSQREASPGTRRGAQAGGAGDVRAETGTGTLPGSLRQTGEDIAGGIGRAVERATTFPSPEQVGESALGGLQQVAEPALGVAASAYDALPQPAKTALGFGLDIMSRPNYASAGWASETLRKQRPGESPLEYAAAPIVGAGRGLLGLDKKTYGDVLGEQGMPEGPARDVAGFVGDVALDPSTYLSMGTTAGAKVGARGVARGALKASIPFTKAEKVLTTFDPLAAVVDAASRAADLTGPTRAIKQGLGEAFVSNYKLKAAGFGDVAEGLTAVKRAPMRATQEAAKLVREKFGPLTEAQRQQFFELADQGLEATLGAGKTADDIGDDAVKTIYSWYSGEYQPWLRQVKESMGLDSFLDNYIRHVFPQKLPTKRVGTGSRMQKRNPGSFLERTGAEGFTTDPRIAVGFDHAETMSRKALNTFIDDTVNKYGVKLRPDDAVPEGMREFFPTGRQRFYPVTDATGAEHMAVRGGVRYALPEPVARAMYDLTNPRQTVGLLKAFDAVQAIWKSSVTSYFPEYHARNMLGNVYNNWLAGVVDPRAYLQAAKVQVAMRTGDFSKIPQIAGQRTQDLVRAMDEKNALNVGFYGGEILGELTRAGVDKNRMVQALTAGRSVGQALEVNARLAHVIDQVGKGVGVEDAIRSCRQFLFDYNDLSVFEKGVLRRVVPFYTWTRKNVPLQIEQLIRQPGKGAAVEKVRRTASQEDEYKQEMQLAPYYVTEQLNVVLGEDEQGRLRVLSGIGLPIEDLNVLFRGTPKRTLDRLASMGSPLLRVPIELGTGQSAFTGRPISDESLSNYYRKTNSLVAAVPGLRDWLGIREDRYTDKTGKERTSYQADPVANYVFLAVLGRFASTAGKFSPEDRSIPGAVAEVTIPGKEYIVDPTRSLSPYTTSMKDTQADKSGRLEDMARQFYSGGLSGDQAREIRSRILTESGQAMDILSEQATTREAGYLPGLQDREALRRQILPDSEKLLAEYYSIQPGPTEPMESFYDRLDQFKSSLSPGQQRVLEDARQKSLDRLRKTAPTAARFETEYRQALGEYGEYRGLAGLDGLSPGQRQTAAAFEKRLADTRRALGPNTNNQMTYLLVAAEDPVGAAAYQQAQRAERGAAGKIAKRMKQEYWASHPLLSRFFGDSTSVVPQAGTE